MKISVCIPAYKNAAFLKRNLDALVTQTFRDFEVILSDDSPDESVSTIAAEYEEKLAIVYLRNSPSKGTPANWNFAIRHASGEFIKLMHDDDWLATDTALQDFLDVLNSHPTVDFCFSAFYNVNIHDGNVDPVFCSSWLRYLLKKNRYNLFKRNFIGPPSVVFQRNTGDIFYDEELKWLVDFEGYIRFLGKGSRFIYHPQPLVNIGISREQVTATTQHNKKVVLPESLYFLKKHGPAILKNLFVYDYFWRTFRNFNVRDMKDIADAGWVQEVPEEVKKMISFQKRIPAGLLPFGPFSKLLMCCSYIVNR